MAYVLGFFTADGDMFTNPRGAHYFAFTSTDYELIDKIKEFLNSEHKIGSKKGETNKKIGYRLQIGSKMMFNDLIELGLTPNKSKTIRLPKIPKLYFNHFLRGYFDGDGCISFGFYKRKNRNSDNFIITTRFSSGNILFLKDLWKKIKENVNIQGGGINKKKKGGFDLVFSIRDSLKIYNFIYKDIEKDYFLKRKYNTFQKAIKQYGPVA